MPEYLRWESRNYDPDAFIPNNQIQISGVMNISNEIDRDVPINVDEPIG